MKKLIGVLLLLATNVWSQNDNRPTLYTSAVTITLDSTETEKVWLGFYGNKKSDEVMGFSATVSNPPNVVNFTGDGEINVRLDSLSTGTESDSLAIYMIETNSSGIIKGDTLWADTQTRSFTADSTREYFSWVSYSRDTTSALPLNSFNFTGKLTPSFGFELGLIQVANDSLGTGNGFRSRAIIEAIQVK